MKTTFAFGGWTRPCCFTVLDKPLTSSFDHHRYPIPVGSPGVAHQRILFIAAALDRTGGLFLLDLGHARPAAWHRGWHLLKVALERAKPRVLTLEYGGAGPLFANRTNEGVLAKHLGRLGEVALSVK